MQHKKAISVKKHQVLWYTVKKMRKPRTVMKLRDEIASVLHEHWMREHKAGETDFERVTDKRFIKNLPSILPKTIRKEANGNVYIDIANTPYKSLSRDWQRENKLAASVVVRLLRVNRPLSQKYIGTVIHKHWLKRHPWARQDGVLNKPFSYLPKSEQHKDLNQFAVGLYVLQEHKRKQKK